MNRYSFILLIVVTFNYFVYVYAENSYYICAVLRKEKDDYYDDASQKVQNKIDKLVNERMNDIYAIIKENKHTYILENGKMDKKLKELESSNEKRDLGNKKFLFINEKRSLHQFRSQSLYKRSTSNDDDDDLIPHNSKLVSHICPIKNYYAIRVYLSDVILEKVESLPNIKYCEKSIELEEDSYTTSDNQDAESEKDSKDSNSKSDPYYDLDFIQKETNWTRVGIQEIGKDSQSSDKFLLSYLPVISQSHYIKENTKEFDYNYYYPKSGGKGIDIFIIDSGLDTSYDDFDTYEGTEHERVVMCDGLFDDNKKIEAKTTRAKRYCVVGEDNIHGHAVSAAAGGKYVGAAKYANIHMLASSLFDVDELNALDHIKSNGQPHKTVVNISRGGSSDRNHAFRDKFEELTEYGIIIVVSAANDDKNCCVVNELFTGFNTTIKVGATECLSYKKNIKFIYERASYSNYGACVDIYAPGETLYPIYNGKYELYGNRYNVISGTSLSSPLTAGVIATLLSEQPEVKHTYETMRQLLIDLSVKDVIRGLQSEDTPNRLLNNGKKIVYSPANVYDGCGASSGYSKCPEGSCCSSTNQCFEIGKYEYNILDQCLVERGCQPEFGTCFSHKQFKPSKVTSTLYITPTSRPKVLPTSTKSLKPTTLPAKEPITECGGKKAGKCTIVNPQNTAYIAIGCCNKDGSCGMSSDHCGVDAGCQNKFGMCLMNSIIPSSSATVDETNKSKIGQKCGKEHGSCVVLGEDGRTYEHISCCSEKGYCGLSKDHCGKGCQSEFGICYSNHHNIPDTQSSEITITVTTLPAVTSSMSITTIESTESIPITESIPVTTESIPITESTTSTTTKHIFTTKHTTTTENVSTTKHTVTTTKHTSTTKNTTTTENTTDIESTPITESTTHVRSTKSTVIKTVTITKS